MGTTSTWNARACCWRGRNCNFDWEWSSCDRSFSGYPLLLKKGASHMNLLGVLDISGSALTAERQRAEVLASNLANAQTTRTAKGGPYQRQLVVFRTRQAGKERFAGVLSGFSERYAQGVEVKRVVPDPTPPVQRYEPAHPDADSQGYVAYPSINP